jgi:hypothetical protein
MLESDDGGATPDAIADSPGVDIIHAPTRA